MTFRFLFLTAWLLFPALSARAYRVTRGPYLQTLTPDSVVVRWRTDEPTTNQIHYGSCPNQCDQRAWSHGFSTDHVVHINGLQPNTRYYYDVETKTTAMPNDAASFSFTTAPIPGTRQPIRVWVLGDSGTASAGAAAVRDAYERFNGPHHTDLWLMLGDNAYRRGSDAEYQKAVFEEYPVMLRRAPLWPTLGNHDYKSCNAVGQSGVYYDIFDLPTKGQAGGIRSCSKAYYSFDFGNAHFICLDSNQTDYSEKNPMLHWLRNDLRANRCDWTIAYFHHPPYSRGSHDSDQPGERMNDVREHLVPLLEAGGTDLVLTGHSHSYERSFLLDGFHRNASAFSDSFKKDRGDGREDGQGAYRKPTLSRTPHEGTVYVVAGSSGQAVGGRLDHPAMCISTNSLGSLVLDINSNRLDATFINDRAERLDHFTIIKGSMR